MIPFEGVLIRPLAREIARHTGHVAHLSNCQFKIVASLLLARGSQLSWHELVDMLYGDDPEGGASWATSALGDFVGEANKKLRPLGLKIIGNRGCKGGRYAVDLWATENSQVRKVA